MAVLRHGEPAGGKRAHAVRCGAGSCPAMGHRTRVACRYSGSVHRCVYHGGSVGIGCRALWRSNHGRGAHVGLDDTEWFSRIRVSVQLLHRNVRAARNRWGFVWRTGPVATFRRLDDLGEARFRNCHARRRRVLPDQDGTASHMKRRLLHPLTWVPALGMAAVVGLTAISALSSRLSAQDLGLQIGTAGPAAKLETLDGKS